MRFHQVVALCGIAGLLCGVRAEAFWSAVYTVHQDLTSQALNRPIYRYNGVGYAFSDRAIATTKLMHEIVDSAPPERYDARDHFDSEDFAGSWLLLISHRQAIMQELSAPSTLGAQQRVWGRLGLVLHQLQDFYAHSSYLQTGASIVDFGSASTQAVLSANPRPNLPPALSSAAATQADAVCLAGGAALSSPVTKITTGYYPPKNTPAGKCNHGLINGAFNFSVAIKNCLQTLMAGVVIPDGINKDHPCITNPTAKLDHVRAKGLAAKETEAFVQSIVADLSLAQNLQGFCTLLGLDTLAAPCNGSAASGGTLPTFVEWKVGDVAFGPHDPCSNSSALNGCSAYNGVTGGKAQVYVRFASFDMTPAAGDSYIHVNVDGAQPLTLTNGVQRVPIAATRGPLQTFPLNSTSEFDAATLKSFGAVGLDANKVVRTVPSGYPSRANLWSTSYLIRNPAASPGTLTVQLEAVPIVPTPTLNVFGTIPVANIYASGSFSFYVADLSVLGALNVGSHLVQGTYRVPVGKCTNVDLGNTMTCPLGNGSGY